MSSSLVTLDRNKSFSTGQFVLSEYDLTISGAWLHIIATEGVDSGKWYWEIKTENMIINDSLFGLATNKVTNSTIWGATGKYCLLYKDNGTYSYENNKASETYIGSDVWKSNDIVSIMLDVDNGTWSFAINGVIKKQNIHTNLRENFLPEKIYPCFMRNGDRALSNQTLHVNFGGRPFQYKNQIALAQDYLPYCDIPLPNTHTYII